MDEKEIILRRSLGLEAVSAEEYADYFRTKDMYCAAFLISRGFEWQHLEQVEITENSNKFGKNSQYKKKQIFFLFPGKSKCQRMAMNFFNSNRANLNINADNFVRSILTVRSVITNPPF